MIVQSPESDMPEPYKTYVCQRSSIIADVLGEIVHEDLQLCPRAILKEEKIVGRTGLAYGAVVANLDDGYKTVLYSDRFQGLSDDGLVASDAGIAEAFASKHFARGNRVRIKDPRESDGNGQYTVETSEEVLQSFDGIVKNGSYGVVLMPHLDIISRRVSVGCIDLGRFGVHGYLGNEQTIRHEGADVYGGTRIGLFSNQHAGAREQVARELDIPQELAKLGVQAIKRYSEVVVELGRVSVDVIQGKTDGGEEVTSVIDITPRVGGVTPAEVLALRELSRQKESDLICYASSRLLYNPSCRPTSGLNFIDTESLIINAQVDGITK